MFRLFIHLFSFNCLFALIIALITIFLNINKAKIRKNKKGFILFLIPFILCLVHFKMFYLHKATAFTFQIFGLMYLSTIILFITYLVFKKSILSKISSIITSILSIFAFLSILFGTISMENFHNLTNQSYTDSFINTIKILKKEYPLSEYKKIDYDKLYNKYYNLIKKAEDNKNKDLYLKTMYEFSHEFKDGHFHYEMLALTDEDLENNKIIISEFSNRDYGFGTILLDNGNVIATMVDTTSEAYQNGISDGTVITKKNGKDIIDIIDDVNLPINRNFPVKKDERFIKSFWLFSFGEETISVSFITSDGEEKTINLQSKTENIKDRGQENYNKLFFDNSSQDSYTTKMLNNDTGYMYIADESYNYIKGAIAYFTGNSKYLDKVIDSKLKELKASGMQKLVIDLRGNTGGYDTESATIASYFTSDTYYFSKTGKYNSNLFDKSKIIGNGKYINMPVYVLVNSETVSAGDGLVYLLSKCDNVKIVGITTSNNSYQSVGGLIFLSNGTSYLTYPIYTSLDMNDNIMIDTDDTGVANIQLDYKIPVNENTVANILDADYDYELDYLLKNIIN